MGGPNILFYAGCVICGLVVLRMAVAVASAISRLRWQRQVQRLRLHQLEAEIRQAQPAVAGPAGDRAWPGLRKFRVKWKMRESADCQSIYLVPHDEKPLPTFVPGQYITLSLRLPGSKQPLVRCYTLSDRPRAEYYRITVKRVSAVAEHGPRPGQVSSYLLEQLCEGDVVDVMAPQGTFVLSDHVDRPAVMIAGGIGVTPFVSMLADIGYRKSNRPVILFYSVRAGTQHTFRKLLTELESNCNNVHMYTFYTRPVGEDRPGDDYDVAGRITLQYIRSGIPSSDCEYYLCGPAEMIESLRLGLLAWEVPLAQIHTEAFGAPSIRKICSRANSVSEGTVVFDRSHRSVPWDGQFDSLLEMAAAHGVDIDSGCRAGNCGTCATAVKEGRVSYLGNPGAHPDEGVCLPCVCVPDGNLVLDA